MESKTIWTDPDWPTDRIDPGDSPQAVRKFTARSPHGAKPREFSHVRQSASFGPNLPGVLGRSIGFGPRRP
jgi:hypothetical protein